MGGFRTVNNEQITLNSKYYEGRHKRMVRQGSPEITEGLSMNGFLLLRAEV
jgi:hypothetical protein